MRRSEARRTAKELRRCRYSPDCFKCPMPDCVSGRAHLCNEILSKELYNLFVNDRKPKEKKT